MIYKLRWGKHARRNRHSVPDRIKLELLQTVLDLQHDPYPPDAEELRDHYAGIWKIKIDGWRIFFTVKEQDEIVTILAIKRRTPDTYNSIP